MGLCNGRQTRRWKDDFSLDEAGTDQFYAPELTSDLTPEKLFDARWAMTVLELALANLKEETSSKANQFDALKVYLTDEPAEGQYGETAARLGMTTQAVAVAVHRLRQHSRELVRAEVAQTVATPLDLEQEIRHLFEELVR